MISTLLLDIETTALTADLGVILCACGKDETGRKFTYRIDEMGAKEWSKGKRGNDEAIVEALIKELTEYDIIVAHNGNGFDLPFIRSRAIYWGLSRVPDIKIIDPLKILWDKFRLKRNTLANISDFIGSKKRKDHLDMSIWVDVILNGTKSSLDKIVAHCVSDVDELEDVLDAVKPYIRVLNDKGSSI